ncbi:MAG: pyridoxamine 5'-phosphate oxidase family protein [Pleurocapsa sp. SU_196_0]|nr:pyridoxamine 5'-phosphate oxidase family protein [Pleurocapsa sp. SU_196_0]
MGKQLPQISKVLQEFIERQQMFFVGTAAADGRVNVSPKGMDSLRVLSPNRVAWLNVTGSGNESAAHLLENPRMTVMFCAFEGAPMILRLYGQARAVHPRDAEWSALFGLFTPLPGARQVFVLEVDFVQTSCGMGVPFFDHVGTREDLNKYWGARDETQLETYWADRNTVSIDGKPTGIAGSAQPRAD